MNPVALFAIVVLCLYAIGAGMIGAVAYVDGRPVREELLSMSAFQVLGLPVFAFGILLACGILLPQSLGWGDRA